MNLEPDQNGYALVMEDCDGISLEQFAQHQPQTLTIVEIQKAGATLNTISLPPLERSHLNH